MFSCVNSVHCWWRTLTRPSTRSPSNSNCPQCITRSTYHHVRLCDDFHRDPGRQGMYTNSFSTQTSRSHVSTSTWDDASGARWMTDDEASVFPPTSSRAIDGWGVEPASRRRARDVDERTRRGVKNISSLFAFASRALGTRRSRGERRANAREGLGTTSTARESG